MQAHRTTVVVSDAWEAMTWLVALGALALGYVSGLASVVGVFLFLVLTGGPRDVDR